MKPHKPEHRDITNSGDIRELKDVVVKALVLGYADGFDGFPRRSTEDLFRHIGVTRWEVWQEVYILNVYLLGREHYFNSLVQNPKWEIYGG